MLLQLLHGTGKHLLHQPADDLDASQVAFVNGPICRLSGECFLMQGPVRIAIKEATDLILEFPDANDSLLAQLPCHVLVGKPFPADDRIHEVTLDGITSTKGDIVASLHHAGAAALPNESFDGNRDLRAFWGRLL